jgi:AcrR family transcriptional regulator
MTTTAPSSPGAATKARLLRAAIVIAAGEGMAAATTAAIAQEAGVAEGTLYRHFDSKDDLLIAAYRQMKHDVFILVAERIDATLPPPERLKTTWKGMFLAYRADRDAFVFGQRFSESALADREGGEAHRAVSKIVADMRRAGVASGDFKNLPVELLATSFFFGPLTYMVKSEIKGRRWTEAELDAAADSILAAWAK